MILNIRLVKAVKVNKCCNFERNNICFKLSKLMCVFPFSAAYNTYPQYYQNWGVQPTAPPNPGYSYSHQQPYPPPPPVSQTMPPPTYAESVVSGQPLRFSS